jgi:ABC-2 type transport system permease protein
MWANVVRSRLVGAKFRIGVAAICSVLFWLGLYAVFYTGFLRLNMHRLVTGPLIELLFGLFFASLLMMLVFSTSIILYGGLFRSQEASFLLVRPIPTDRVFAFKFVEALAFSSWGFLLLGSPMTAAYGATSGAPWWYYALGVPFFGAFSLLPGSLGALATLLAAAFAPRSPKRFLLAAGCVAAAAAVGVGFRAWLSSRDAGSAAAWIESVAAQLRVSNLPFLPSQWISRGLLAAAYERGWKDALFYLGVLSSQAAATYLLAAWTYRRWYRKAYDRIASSGASRRKRSRTWLPAVVDRMFWWFSGPVKVLLVKDVRIFSRDPLQWLQILIFAGLLAIYFSNLHRVTAISASPYWRNLMGFFNVGVTGLLLAAYTSRFIFPLMSLEGQKFWILGLAPISRRAILWSKFAFSVAGALVVTVVLTIVSAFMLQLDLLLIVLQVVSVVVICFGVSGIAVGFGAKFPDLSESDPSKIASGFGGTLNLVASLMFLTFVVVAMALPCHLYSMTLEWEAGLGAAMEIGLTAETGISFEQFRILLAASIAVSVLVGVLATILPMRMGVQAFEKREF